ncbi:MAG: ribonuclease HII [Clostridia bacterium]|nr:ribonuclease HII [Clostridia bacterium]
MPDYKYEREALSQGYKIIAGTDEAGRGPLAGPVYAAAVILPDGLEIEGLDDSKKLTEKKRDVLFDIICEKAISYAIAFSTVEEIDELNILNASQLAMRRAVDKLSPKPDYVIVDGNVARDFPMKTIKLIKGDSLSTSVAAASILAKVSRDRYCAVMDEQYPEYEFLKHKGYGTALHMQKIREFGVSPVHRKTFMGFLSKEKK